MRMASSGMSRGRDTSCVERHDLYPVLRRCGLLLDDNSSHIFNSSLHTHSRVSTSHEDYARQIARDWNVKAGGAGFVTKFAVSSDYLKGFQVHVVAVPSM
jgi:hypothetical protein